jgi:hypothetical protein
VIPLGPGGARGAPAFFELKWGSGRRTLGECVWDAAKMSVAVARGRASAAFLVAGAPARRWREPIEGPELFERGTLTVGHLRGEPYLGSYWTRFA